MGREGTEREQIAEIRAWRGPWGGPGAAGAEEQDPLPVVTSPWRQGWGSASNAPMGKGGAGWSECGRLAGGHAPQGHCTGATCWPPLMRPTDTVQRLCGVSRYWESKLGHVVEGGTPLFHAVTPRP